MIGLALAVMAVTGAPTPTGAFLVQHFGGDLSCASWLADPARKETGKAWIAGYWTGANSFDPRDHTVGHNTDFHGIVGETELICRASPSMTLWTATNNARLKLRGR